MRYKTAFIILIFIAAGLTGVATRCFYLQYYKADYYSEISAKAQRTGFLEKPRRGAILDCKGKILAASYKVDTVFAEPNAIIDLKKTAKDVSAIIGIGPVEISKLILTGRNPGYAPILIDAKLTDEQRKQLLKIDGIGIESGWKRFYPLGNAAVHAVGFVGTEQEGLAGLELKYNKQLSGSIGRSSFFADAARRPVRLGKYESFAEDGSDIITTIDSTIQEFTHSALLKQFKAFEAESAVALVMDPCSGAILSMVSLPDFDPTNLKDVDAKSLGNHILCDPYEPGSIFKPVVAAWGLETGSINPDDSIFCENGHYSGKGFGTIGEYHDGGYGTLTISEILAHSSNIGMAKIGQKMGAAKLHEGVKLFGFGRKTGIDLPGEEPGVVWNLNHWTGYSIARVPFGHEISVTAIQMACAYCTIANGGRTIKPHIVKAIVRNAGKKVELIEPSPTSSYVISGKTAQWLVSKAMVDVVKIGTGKSAALQNWQVWGKTGTANIANAGGTYDEQNYVASFIGGAPVDNPAIVVTVSIRKPNKSLGKGYAGGAVAAPVAKEILEKTLTYLKIEKLKKEE
ncbi:MAG: penicillin-binding protein 2 [Sedimentisphaerales bacterium]